MPEHQPNVLFPTIAAIFVLLLFVAWLYRAIAPARRRRFALGMLVTGGLMLATTALLQWCDLDGDKPIVYVTMTVLLWGGVFVCAAGARLLKLDRKARERAPQGSPLDDVGTSAVLDNPALERTAGRNGPCDTKVGRAPGRPLNAAPLCGGRGLLR